MYTLSLFTSVLSGNDFVMDLTDLAQKWRRTKRAQGGDWQGSFIMEGDERELQNLFHLILGYDLQERLGSTVTWRGMVYEMEFVGAGGLRRRVSLDDMYNYVTTTYIDDSDTVQESAAASQTQSIAKYGRREELLTLDGYAQATAENERDTFLAGAAWPLPKVVAGGQGEPATLEVRVCGYIFTANWRHVSVQDGASDDLDDYLQAIVGTDCEFLGTSKITTNTLAVLRKTNTATRAWDQLQELTALGDASQNRYQIFCDVDNNIVYQAIDTNPLYRWTGKGLEDTGGELVPPWLVKPAVVVDATYHNIGGLTDDWLPDARYFFIDEVSAGVRSGLSFKTDYIGDQEILSSMNEYAEWVDDNTEEAPTKTGKGKWNWGDMTDEQRDWWTGGKKGPAPKGKRKREKKS